MPSGGRGSAPPKSAQWVVSHYRIDYNTLRVWKYAPDLQRHAYKRTGLPPAGAAVGVSHVVVCVFVRKVGTIMLYQ